MLTSELIRLFPCKTDALCRNDTEQLKPENATNETNDQLTGQQGEAEPTDKQDNNKQREQTNSHAEAEKPGEESKNEGSKLDEPPSEAEDKEERPSEEENPATHEKSMADEKPAADDKPQSAANGEDAIEPNARDGKVPSSILEKGILYFLYRGRVNVDSPDNVQDIARSYLILRPLPHGAKLSDGPMKDDKNCRLIAIPKKKLPLSGKDRWTAFVEKSNASISELKESFLKSSDYETQSGPRHTPAVTPAAEAVYAITTTGRESHLAYITTLPENLDSIQNDLGLRPKGSFILSTKNPKAPGPANANIGKDPGYSQAIMDSFRSLRWAPSRPEHLDYVGCQFLMIGEGEQGLDKATEPQEGDEKKEEPKRELEKLEGEDEIRVGHLNGKSASPLVLGVFLMLPHLPCSRQCIISVSCYFHIWRPSDEAHPCHILLASLIP